MEKPAHKKRRLVQKQQNNTNEKNNIIEPSVYDILLSEFENDDQVDHLNASQNDNDYYDETEEVNNNYYDQAKQIYNDDDGERKVNNDYYDQAKQIDNDDDDERKEIDNDYHDEEEEIENNDEINENINLGNKKKIIKQIVVNSKIWLLKCVGDCNDLDLIENNIRQLAEEQSKSFLIKRVLKFGDKLYKLKKFSVLKEFLNQIKERDVKVKSFFSYKNYLSYFKFNKEKAELWSDDKWNVWWSRSAIIIGKSILAYSSKHGLLFSSKFQSNKKCYYIWDGCRFEMVCDNITNIETKIIAPIVDKLVPYILEKYPLKHDRNYWQNEACVGRSNRLSRAVWLKIKHEIKDVPCQQFNQNGYAFVDKNGKVYSTLLSTSDGIALKIAATPRLKITHKLQTRYNPNAVATSTVVTTLKCISNNDLENEDFVLKFGSGMVTGRHDKFVLVIQSDHSDSGKSTFTNLMQATIGHNIVKSVPGRSFWTRNSADTHDGGVVYGLGEGSSFGIIVKDYNSGNEKFSTSAYAIKSLVGEVDLTRRGVHQGFKTYQCLVTVIFHTNEQTLQLSEVNEAICNKILWLKVKTRLVDSPEEVDESKLKFLKKTDVGRSWQHDVKSREYMLKRLVAANCQLVLQDEWITKETLPDWIRLHSFERHLALSKSKTTMFNEYLIRWMRQNLILKIEEDDERDKEKQPLSLESSKLANKILQYHYGRLDRESFDLISKTYKRNIQNFFEEEVKCRIVRYDKDNRNRKYFYAQYKFW